jgi:hypothetical protein
MRKGSIYLQLSGHRKPTSTYCARCGRFHDTHRGLNPEPCPFVEELPRSAPAYIKPERLGSKRRMTNVPVVLPGLQGGR